MNSKLMESNNQQEQQPGRQSLGKGGKQKSIATIIGILVGIAAVLFVVNGTLKKDNPEDIGNVNESPANENVNASANTNQPVVIDNTNQPPEVITTTVDTSNWKTYRNEELGFEVKYPKEWTNIRLENTEGGTTLPGYIKSVAFSPYDYALRSDYPPTISIGKYFGKPDYQQIGNFFSDIFSNGYVIDRVSSNNEVYTRITSNYITEVIVELNDEYFSISSSLGGEITDQIYYGFIETFRVLN